MMSRSLVSALGAVVLLSLVSALAFAGQPDPGSSQVISGPYMGCSPKNTAVSGVNQFVVQYRLNDGSGPVEGFPASQVELDFDDCFNPSTRPADEIPADGPSNASGDVFWIVNIEFGGGDPCAVDILVQNVLFATLEGEATDPAGGLRSPDIDGDGSVQLLDLAQFQPAFVTGGPAWVADYDFSTTVGLNDLAIFQAHFTAP